jgi:hypothetical protein
MGQRDLEVVLDKNFRSVRTQIRARRATNITNSVDARSYRIRVEITNVKNDFTAKIKARSNEIKAQLELVQARSLKTSLTKFRDASRLCFALINTFETNITGI